MDCLEGLKQLEDNSIDLILTDPPYFFETHGRGFAKERDYLNRGLKEIGVNNNYNYTNRELLQQLIRVCKKETNVFIFCNKAQILNILEFAREKELNFELIALCKRAPMPLSNNQWLPDREWGIHLFKNCSVKGSYKVKRGFFVSDNYKDETINHPSVKPLSIIRKLILNLTNEKDIVLDCFMGSGTTALACKQLKRDYMGFEINPKYIKIADERLMQENLIGWNTLHNPNIDKEVAEVEATLT